MLIFIRKKKYIKSNIITITFLFYLTEKLHLHVKNCKYNSLKLYVNKNNNLTTS